MQVFVKDIGVTYVHLFSIASIVDLEWILIDQNPFWVDLLQEFLIVQLIL